MSNVTNSKLSVLLKNTQQERSVNAVLPPSRNIAMQITGYVEVGDTLIAKGVDLLTQKDIEVNLKVNTSKPVNENAVAPRTMADIKDVSPVGTIVQFNSCFEDKNKPSRYTAYQVRTPFNVIVAEGQKKHVNFNVTPGRLIQTQSKRWAAVTYDYRNGAALTSLEQTYEKAAQLFSEKKAVYIRVRVDSPAENLKKNEAFEFFPVVESVTVEGGKKIGRVDVEASLNKIKSSVVHKYWLNELESLQEHLGKEVNIDLMPIDITWGSASARRENKKTIEQKAYALDKRNGFFSPEVKMITNSDGSPARYYDTVATNIMLAELVTTQDGQTIRTATSATALGTECNFTSISELPIAIDGRLAYQPDEQSIFRRRLTMDGTYAREVKPADDLTNDKAQAAEKAPQAQAPVSEAQALAHQDANDSLHAAELVVPDVDDSIIGAMDEHYHPADDEYDPLAGLADGLSVEEIIEALDDLDGEADSAKEKTASVSTAATMKM